MLDIDKINALARQLRDALPQGLRDLPGDLEDRFRDVLKAGLTKMDLVTREEFDVQVKVLQRTRERIDQLEKQLRDSDQDG